MPRRFVKHNIENHSRNMPAEDNVYIDIKVNNKTDQRTINAIFNQAKTRQVVDNPSNYYLTMARWKLPAFEFPLLIFPIQPAPNTDPYRSEYSITMETDTDIVQVFLFFTGYDDSKTAPSGPPTTPAEYEYYFVYGYQQMVDMVNEAFELCFQQLTGKPANVDFSPFMFYEPETKLFAIQAEINAYSVDTFPTPVPPANPTTQPTYFAPIKIYFNWKLYSLFNGFSARFTDPDSAEATQGRDVQILVRDFGNNVINQDFLEMRQNFSSVAYWSPIKQLIFETNLLPINSEYTSTTDPASFKKVLTDFEPIADSNQDIRTTLQYYPRGAYRLTDLVGTNPIFNIDLQAKWLDLDGNEYFVKIPPFQQFSAKLLFTKRNLHKSDNMLYES